MEEVIGKTCSSKVDVESKPFETCVGALQKGYGQYSTQFGLLDLLGYQFTVKVLCNVLWEHKLLKKKICELEGRLAKIEAKEKGEGQEEADDEDECDSGGGGNSEHSESECKQRPAGEKRFTQLADFAKVAWPEECRIVHQKKTIHQQRMKDIAAVQKQIKEVNGKMEAADGKAMLGMVKRMNILKKRLLVKEEEQALHFKEGCALAKELNNRKVSAEQLRSHKARDGDKIAGMVELTYAAVRQQRRAYKALTADNEEKEEATKTEAEDHVKAVAEKKARTA